MGRRPTSGRSDNEPFDFLSNETEYVSRPVRTEEDRKLDQPGPWQAVRNMGLGGRWIGSRDILDSNGRPTGNAEFLKGTDGQPVTFDSQSAALQAFACAKNG